MIKAVIFDNYRVIEDAPHGIAAAKNAGMVCMGLLTVHRTRQELKAADLIVKRLSDIDVSNLGNLRKRNI